ncbi:MAG: GspE/PulE family protein [Acidobacteriota bacterium]
MPDTPPLPPAERVATTEPVRVVSADRSAVISLAERLIDRALAAGASDLHIEPHTDRLRVRVRVDGWLRDLDPLPSWLHTSLTARFKVMAGMDITERRRPQDGRSCVPHASSSVDLRIASLPTQHGEKIVVRMLPKGNRPMDLRSLGLDSEGLRTLASFVERPQGLILAAGPTGAGKTTTLYALLQRIDSVGRHVVTLEDPIEYTLPDVVQVPVRRAIGVDFAAVLRAVLRQDPDVILVGEIRDEETARVAVRAAITGHLVLSTVHTNSAFESAARLLDLGIPGYLLASALIGVVSQRLVRRLCTHCRTACSPSPEALEVLGLPAPGPSARYYQPGGCPTCRSGFDGRFGLFETLALDRGLRWRLAAGSDLLALEQEAVDNHRLRPLREAARAAVRAGITSADEATRVLPAG